MKTDTLVKLAASGNIKDVEEAWLALLEEEATSDQWKERAQVLETISKSGRQGEAEALAATAIESLSSTLDGAQLLEAAGAFLLGVKDSDAIRQKVGALYRDIHGDVPGLDVLLDEAGVEGGRPPRRALRTMDVCLGLEEGVCLSHRHEDQAARVERINHDTWRIDVNTGSRTETLGAVELADSYRPADEDDFRVMAQFHPDRLSEMLQSEPVRVIGDILRVSGPKMDSDELRQILSPRFISASGWSKWWTKARQALRVSTHIKIEGRSPYFLTYDDSPASYDEETQAALKKAHDPNREVAIIEGYVQGCKLRKQPVDANILTKTRERIEQRARDAFARSGNVDLLPWLAARRIGVLLEDEDASKNLQEALRQSPDPAGAILAVENTEYWPAACAALEQARPDNLADALKRLLPRTPYRVADHLASRLVESGCKRECFEELADRILRSPIEFNEGLLWLWNGPTVPEAQVQASLASIFTRILHALSEVRRSDEIGRETIKRIQQDSRDALKAHRFKRFREMIEQIEPGVAMALRTQLTRLDNIGRTSDDLLRLLRDKFPQLTVVAPKLPMWLQDDVLYVTKEGHKRRHDEIDELVNVKMRENAVAIGKAAALGDLSENSEYKFALEERDLLQARLAQMQKEMDIARILDPKDVPSEYAGIGCHVALEHAATGTRREITILSPWEANPENGVYNYLTPLAQSVLGTKVGEAAPVEFFDPPGDYRVVEVRSALS